MKNYNSSADFCRRRNYTVGTLLRGDEGYGPTVIRITAIGEYQVLARVVSQNGKLDTYSMECSWDLLMRKWRKVSKTKTK